MHTLTLTHTTTQTSRLHTLTALELTHAYKVFIDVFRCAIDKLQRSYYTGKCIDEDKLVRSDAQDNLTRNTQTDNDTTK